MTVVLCKCLSLGYTQAEWDVQGYFDETPYGLTSHRPEECKHIWYRPGIEKLLAEVSFCPGGKAEDKRAFTLPLVRDPRNWVDRTDYWLLRVTYREADSTKPDGPRLKQTTRPWLLWESMTKDEIMDTVFAACQRSQNHVAGEWFTYQGKRIYSPHISLADRLKAAEKL